MDKSEINIQNIEIDGKNINARKAILYALIACWINFNEQNLDDLNIYISNLDKTFSENFDFTFKNVNKNDAKVYAATESACLAITKFASSIAMKSIKAPEYYATIEATIEAKIEAYEKDEYISNAVNAVNDVKYTQAKRAIYDNTHIEDDNSENVPMIEKIIKLLVVGYSKLKEADK